jgi:hypothetical protein
VSYVPPQCSERETGKWEDCTWATGVMLNNAAHGQTVVPSTRAEYEALRVAGGDGPAENPGDGSNNAQLAIGITNRYGWTPIRYGPPGVSHPSWSLVLSALRSVGDCAALQGTMGAWGSASHWRRWDTAFQGPHNVYVQRRDMGDHLWWMNPQAPNSYPGEWISLTEAHRYYDAWIGGILSARVGQLIPPVPPTDVEEPVHINLAQLDYERGAVVRGGRGIYDWPDGKVLRNAKKGNETFRLVGNTGTGWQAVNLEGDVAYARDSAIVKFVNL